MARRIKQLDVCFDDAKKVITIISDRAYTVIGGEGAAGDGLSKTAFENSVSISYDDNLTNWDCYNINGYNYTKLRGVGKTLNFGVTWNAQLKTIEIDTRADYTE